MKKLDTLIFKSFIGPFIITFFIAFFVLMMQNLWKYVDDLVGKGLDFFTVGKFLWYASASMLMLAMPIAILISSIMTFGNLGERFELVAIKSSGISLLRFMRPLIWVSIFLCGITFVFANYVIPYSNLKFVTLYSDIYFKKPALDLKEGVFYKHIPNYSIKVGKKDPDGKTIHDVLIYEKNDFGQDNCIVAKKGVMQISKDQNYLEFILENGCRYELKGNLADNNTEFTRLSFRSFRKLFDISVLKQQETSDSVFMKNSRMLSSRQLANGIDSLKILQLNLRKNITQQLNVNFNINNIKNNKFKNQQSQKMNYENLFPDSLKSQINQLAISKLNMIKLNLQSSNEAINNNIAELRSHELEYQRKYSLSLACLVLFFIGAPLGSIIRKGGLGMPLVVAIVFFLIFHLLMMFGEKFVKEGITSPFIGMWLPILVLTPVGIFLTYKSMNDSQLFNAELYSRFFKKISGIITKKKI